MARLLMVVQLPKRGRSLNNPSVSKNVPDRNPRPAGLRFHANTGQVGFVAIFKHFSGFEFFLLSSRVHARPHATNANN